MIDYNKTQGKAFITFSEVDFSQCSRTATGYCKPWSVKFCLNFIQLIFVQYIVTALDIRTD